MSEHRTPSAATSSASPRPETRKLDKAGSGESQPVVLIVDDDRTLCHLVEAWLAKAGYQTQVFHDGESCLAALAHTLPEAVCLDLHLPGLSGLDTLESIKSHLPTLPVLILTGDTQVETIVTAMRRGAYDYLPKPINRSELTNRLKHAVDSYRMSLRLTQLEREVEGRGYPGIVGASAPMKGLFRHMDRLTRSDITLLIHGESGTGKELVAQAIHQQSARRSGPFVAVNCAAIPETLQESELFGHEKGSFTGATTRRIGKFEMAHRGTLFLDEVAELSLPAQAKLLRVLQERKFSRVGATREQSSDFRLIAATHRSLSDRVEQGQFREDLYFRVAVFDLDVPPLRQRLDDVPLLCQHFLGLLARRESEAATEVSPDALKALCSYHWPGNVRELQNALQRASVLSDGSAVERRFLPPRILEALSSGAAIDGSPPQVDPPVAAFDNANTEDGVDDPVKDGAATPEPSLGAVGPEGIRPLEDIERDAIRIALEQLGGNLSRVCRELGIGRTTLYRKLKKYELR